MTDNDVLKNSFTKLMNQDQSIIEQELDKLRERLRQEKNGKHTIYCCYNVLSLNLILYIQPTIFLLM